VKNVSVHAVGLAAAALALLVAAAALPLDAPPLSWLSCPLRAATGWPCLFCGCTHAFAHAVRGEMAAAFASSPLGALLALGCAAHVAITALRLCGARIELPEPRWGRAPRMIAVALLAANWAFLAARARGVL
jgi:hypothetical protein